MKRVAFIFVVLVMTAFAHSAIALEQTDTGFYYPVGERNFDQACGGWLFGDRFNTSLWRNDQNCPYFDGVYHIGVDMMTRSTNPEDETSHVYAVSAGEILDVHSSSDWGITNGVKNVMLFVRHETSSGEPFVAYYGHLQLSPRIKDNLRKGDNYVAAGEYIGYTGYYSGGVHLHFGITLGSNIRSTNAPEWGWGRAKNVYWSKKDSVTGEYPFTNGFVDPVEFIESNHPNNSLYSENYGFTNLESLMFFTDCMETDLCGKDDLKGIVDQPFVDQLCNGNATIGDFI